MDQTTPANETYHGEHLLDRAAMLAMRTMVALQPAADPGPGGRAAFDELMAKTPAADGVTYEAAALGGVPGWWCRPGDADAEYRNPLPPWRRLRGGTGATLCHFAGQVATRAKAPAFVADYGLAPEPANSFGDNALTDRHAATIPHHHSHGERHDTDTVRRPEA